MKSVTQPKIHPITLRFNDCDLEQDFLDDYAGKALRHVRVALLVGIFLYGIFGVLDSFIIPHARNVAWTIRYAIVIPILTAVYAASYSRHFKTFMQPLLSGMILITGFGIIAMLVLAEPPGTYLYYAGLILVIMYAYTFLRLRLQFAAMASWTLVLAYELAAILVSPLPVSMLVNNTFFLLSANLIGMFAAYQMESFIRLDFLQRKALHQCEDQKHLREKEQMLKDLHDGVGGMTTHIAMLADMAHRKRSPEDMKRALMSIAELAEDSLLEIRSFMRSLDRKDLTWEACAAELRSIGGLLLEPHDISFVLRTSIQANRERPDSLVYLHIFKIYREAVTNIVKHARATVVEAAFEVNSRAVHLSINDNGVGFVQDSGNGRGLRNMCLRAQEIGGILTIRTAGGTEIQLDVPLAGSVPAHGRTLLKTT